MHGDPQQRPGSQDIVAVPAILTEIFQALQRGRHLLDLVQNNQSILRVDLHPALDGKATQDPIHIKITGEQVLHSLIAVKIDIGALLKRSPAKLLHQPGLSHLPRAADDHRQAVRILLPLLQTVDCISLHRHTPPRPFDTISISLSIK